MGWRQTRAEPCQSPEDAPHGACRFTGRWAGRGKATGGSHSHNGRRPTRPLALASIVQARRPQALHRRAREAWGTARGLAGTWHSQGGWCYRVFGRALHWGPRQVLIVVHNAPFASFPFEAILWTTTSTHISRRASGAWQQPQIKGLGRATARGVLCGCCLGHQHLIPGAAHNGGICTKPYQSERRLSSLHRYARMLRTNCPYARILRTIRPSARFQAPACRAGGSSEPAIASPAPGGICFTVSERQA